MPGGRPSKKDKTCVALNSSGEIYLSCDTCRRAIRQGTWGKNEFSKAGWRCDRIGRDPVLLMPEQDALPPRRGSSLRTAVRTSDRSRMRDHGSRPVSPKATPGPAKKQRPARSYSPDTSSLRDKRRNTTRPRGADAGRHAAAAGVISGGRGTAGHGAVALSRMALSGPAATNNVLAGKGGIGGMVADASGARAVRLRKDSAPAMAGAGMLFAPDDGIGAVVLAAAELQTQLVEEAEAETNPTKKQKLLGQIRGHLGTAAETARKQVQVMTAGVGHCLPCESGATSTRAQAQAAVDKALAAPLASNPAFTQAVGTNNIEWCKGKKPQERRPVVAAFCRDKSCTREGFENELQAYDEGGRVSNDEWCAARRHALHPGAFNPIPKVAKARQGIQTSRLQHFLAFLGKPGILQQYAFGWQVYKALNGELFRLDQVARLIQLEPLVKQYLELIDEELGEDVDLPSQDERCQVVSRDYGHAQCRSPAATCCSPGSRHKFTRSGGMCGRTIAELAKALTNKEVKSLSGLDNIKTVQGMLNFQAMRKLATQLGSLAGQSAAGVIKEVEDSEMFMKVDFCKHVGRESDFACGCLCCGLHDPAYPVSCEQQHSANSCEHCVASLSVFSSLRTMASAAEARLSASAATPHDKDDLADAKHQIGLCEDAFRHYRAHMAQIVAESEFDPQELKVTTTLCTFVPVSNHLLVLPSLYR